MTSHLDKALDDLARERRRLEERLAASPVGSSRDLMLAFGTTAALRANSIETERLEARARRESVRESAADALGSLFADEPKTLDEALQAVEDTSPGSKPDDGDHPLAGLFA